MSSTRMAAIFYLCIMVAGAVAVMGYDLYAASRWGAEGTLSWQTWTLSQRYPIIPAAVGLVVGALFGHLFWRQSGP